MVTRGSSRTHGKQRPPLDLPVLWPPFTTVSDRWTIDERSIVKTALLVLIASVGLATASGPAAAPGHSETILIQLGTHRFGRLSRPEAVVARAGPHDVGFPSPGAGCCGP